jgi:hypothetical protein
LPGNVQSPMLRRKSLTEEMFQAPHQEQRTTDVEMLPSIRSAGVPSTAAEGGSSQLSRLQQMLPHLSREELEQLIRKNMSSWSDAAHHSCLEYRTHEITSVGTFANEAFKRHRNLLTYRGGYYTHDYILLSTTTMHVWTLAHITFC